MLSRQGHCSRDIHTEYPTRPQDFTTINGSKILQTSISIYLEQNIQFRIWKKIFNQRSSKLMLSLQLSVQASTSYCHKQYNIQ